MILLDTNIVIAYLEGRDKALVRKVQGLRNTEIGIPAVVLAELHAGVAGSTRVTENLVLLERFMLQVELLAFSAREAEWFGVIHAMLKPNGKLIGECDMLIAATALAHGAELATRNRREFEELLPLGLRLPDWGPP